MGCAASTRVAVEPSAGGVDQQQQTKGGVESGNAAGVGISASTPKANYDNSKAATVGDGGMLLEVVGTGVKPQDIPANVVLPFGTPEPGAKGKTGLVVISTNGQIVEEDNLSQYSRPSTREQTNGSDGAPSPTDDVSDLMSSAVVVKKKKKSAAKIIDLEEEDLETRQIASTSSAAALTHSSSLERTKPSEEERVACTECGRKFNVSRIERHTAACLKRKEGTSRPKFDSKAQRMNVRLAPIKPSGSRPLGAAGPPPATSLVFGVAAEN